ncbi:FKBP-rapamycin associated protein [Culex quinquefasciatus]|uniref:FKBP-rapamycin associated protein n=1 Tax=Culex quinquefasciatus TaxID=7176 RepID=B0VZS8_CULQU|nr:FKBP-rapamycin associated protein [Culex quinquefasciatus]|eukprot:XP_001841962.1 FKBP-rapamycin associated protein [Culex quinquefasciatus]
MRIINPLVHVPDDHSGQVQSAALQILCSIMVFATWRSRERGWRLPIRLTGRIDLLLERGAIRADFTLDFMDQRRDLLLVPEQGKCDADAARFRNTGNRLYLDGKYGEALVWCFAEKESD